MTRYLAFFSLTLMCAALSITPVALSQTTPGLPPFSSTYNGLYDDVKLNDGSILVRLPLRAKGGLIPFSAFLESNIGASVLARIIREWEEIGRQKKPPLLQTC
jgi:hypothetical protein